MADEVAQAPKNASLRVRALPIFAICLIVLTALLELGLAAHPVL